MKLIMSNITHMSDMALGPFVIFLEKKVFEYTIMLYCIILNMVNKKLTISILLSICT